MARKMVELENVNHPGQVKLVDAAMYDTMRRALLKILPKSAPGLTVEETYARVASQLPFRLQIELNCFRPPTRFCSAGKQILRVYGSKLP